MQQLLEDINYMFYKEIKWAMLQPEWYNKIEVHHVLAAFIYFSFHITCIAQ